MKTALKQNKEVMKMAKEKKEFNLKLYAIAVFLTVAVFLSTVTAVTFKGRYNGFSAERTAQAYIQRQFRKIQYRLTPTK